MHPHARLCPLSGWSTVPAIALCVVLLVAAMGITPACACQLPLLPSAATAVALRTEGMTVGVDWRGEVWIGRMRVSDDRMAAALRDSLAARAADARAVHVRADRKAPYGRVQAVLGAARGAGVRRVELLADCPQGSNVYTRACSFGTR
jgi:biopolymer transport protein TolR